MPPPDSSFSKLGDTIPGLSEVDFAHWLRRGMDEHAIVAVTDAQGVIVFANDRFCKISGYAREELIGKTHRLLKSGVHEPSL
jgi:PAS domain-containing protein